MIILKLLHSKVDIIDERYRSAFNKIKMLTKRLAINVPKVLKRNIGIVAPVLQKASDPIQQLFIDKIREYKAKSADGKLVDASPEIQKEKEAELERLAKQFGASDRSKMSQFPTFQFKDPAVDVSSVKD
ncbi:ATP synthase-coupling factor 6, mitochondrial [Colletes latitarsis]|uniref:ATP synthase-coupling factor 6, mitochondrial n=1 Tax=Colletes latitarsis TaxID=2605962 RepID=UPI004036B850